MGISMKKKTMVGLVATLFLATLRLSSPAYADGIDKPTDDSVSVYVRMYCEGTDSLRNYLDLMRLTYPADWNRLRPDLLLRANNVIRYGPSACPAR